MKQVEWNVEERRHGKDQQILYTHGAWTLTVNVNRPNGKVRGHISKRKRHSIVDYLVEGQTLTKGLGIPDYVVNKANELMNPVDETKKERVL